MSTLKEEVAQIDLDAPDVKNSKILQEFFSFLDEKLPKQRHNPDNLKSGEDVDEVKRYLVALAHPYKLSRDATQEIEHIVGTFNPNNDDTATGREIADAIFSLTDEKLRKLFPDDITPEEKKKLSQFVTNLKSTAWAEYCVLNPDKIKNFQEITGIDKNEIESAYHDLWIFERFRQNPLTRWALLEKGDQQDFLRLPQNIMDELPPFIKIPDNKDMCKALRKNIAEADPNNLVIQAGDDPAKVKEALGKIKMDMDLFVKSTEPKQDFPNIEIVLEEGVPKTPDALHPSSRITSKD